MIPFNRPHLTGLEQVYMAEVMQSGQLAGDGSYTRKCERFFENKYGFKKALLTPSCTAALELVALLINIQPGDEVIMPSYTFVSMANAFVLRGAKIIFADSNTDNPNVDVQSMETLITPATRALVIVHYGGIACDIIAVKKLASKHKLYLIEDTAPAINCFLKEQALGSFGHFATFSFHETKNITCGEGGMLVINDKKFIQRAEVIREKGTNRTSFIRKEISKYCWVDLGSSFLLSDISAAFLYAQLMETDHINNRRRAIWTLYYKAFEKLAQHHLIKLPYVPADAEPNGHIFYFICPSAEARTAYITFMWKNGVQTQFHYSTLHDSPFYKRNHGKRPLPLAHFYQNRLVRLPLFYDLDKKEIDKIIELTYSFFSDFDTNI